MGKKKEYICSASLLTQDLSSSHMTGGEGGTLGNRADRPSCLTVKDSGLILPLDWLGFDERRGLVLVG